MSTPRPRYRAGARTYAFEHRAFARLDHRVRTLAGAVGLTVVATGAWVAALPWVARLWGHALVWAAGRLGLGDVTVLRIHDVWGWAVGVPHWQIEAVAPGVPLLFGVGFGSLVLFLALAFLPERWRPGVYLLRAVLLVQLSAVVYFSLWADLFPYTLSDYLHGMMATGLAIATAIPVVLGLTLYVQDLSLVQKAGFTALALGYSAVLVPLQYALHGLAIAGGTLIWMPAIYLFLGVPLHVLALVALYAWAMSWPGRLPTLGIPLPTVPEPTAFAPTVQPAPLPAMPTSFTPTAARWLSIAVALLLGTSSAQAQFDTEWGSATAPATAALPVANSCYAVADGGGGGGGNDWLILTTRDAATQSTVGTGTGTNDIEAAAYWPAGAGVLYAANAGQFGVIDTSTGVFSTIGTGFGSGDGAAGTIAITDVDGLAFDAFTGWLYGSHRRGGVEDLLVRIDPATGALVPDAFGAGVDYVVIGSSAATGQTDIDDIAIDADDGQMYGIANGTSPDDLVQIDKLTGAVVDVGPLGVSDMEGFDFDSFGTLFGSTGAGTSLYSVNESTGVASLEGPFIAGTDHESVACLTDGVNDLGGVLFFDDDASGTYALGTDTPEVGKTVTLYRDVDGSGTLTAGDIAVATDVTDGTGRYGFTIATNGNVLIVPEDLTAGGGAYTTADELGGNLAGFGANFQNINFGYSTAADLSLAAAVDTASPALGANVTFTLTLANAGPADATSVTISAPLPAGYTFVSSDGGAAYDDATGDWTVPGTLASGASTTLDIVATATTTASRTLTAEVTAAGESDLDSTPNNGVGTEDDQDAVSVQAQAIDLSVTTTIDDASPPLGTDVTFTVTVANAGPNGATGVTVSAPLPAGYTFVSSDGGVAYDDATGVWTIPGTIASGGSTTLDIVATPTTTASRTLTAEATAADLPDTDSTPNNGVGTEDDQDSISVQAQAIDLSVTAAVDNASPALGADVTFTITVANAGPNGATGVTVSAPLPAGYTFVSSDGGVAYDDATGIWTIPGTIASGGSTSLDIVATVATTASRTLTSEVTAADLPDTDSTPNNGVGTEDDQDAVSVQAQTIDLSVTTSVDDASPVLGTDVTFTVTVANAGPGGATGVTVSAPLPAGYTFVSSDGGVAYDDATGIWTIPGTLASGGSTSLDIVATATSTAAVSFVAEVDAADQLDSDSTPGNGVGTEDDQDSTAIQAETIDLSVTAAVDNAAPALGADVTFTITVANAGPADATGVTVSAPLPAGYTFVSSDGGVAYDDATGVWTIPGTIASGGFTSLDIVATVATTASRTLTAEVTAADQPDADSTPNNGVGTEDDQDAVSVTTETIDLSVTTSVDDASPVLGTDVTFTVTVANAGPGGATGVTVSAPLPAGYTFVSSDGGVAYDDATGIWTIPGTLASGGSTSLDIVATATSTAAVSFVAEVDAADQLDSDSTPGNGVGTEDDQDSTAIQAETIDLSVTAAVDDASPLLGTDVTFTITVANAGPADATGVTVSAPLPAGYTFVSSDGGVAYDDATGIWTVPGTLASGGSTTLDIVATASTTTARTLTAEVTAADQPDADSTPGNGVGTEDDQDAVNVQAAIPDLALSMGVNDPAPTVGDVVTFTLTLTNESGIDASGIQVSAPFIARTDTVVVVGSTPSAGSYDGALWTVGALAAGASVTLAVQVRLDQDLIAFTALAEVAQMDQTDSDSTPYNGITSEDDYASATATTGGASTAGEGGLESNGSMAQALATVLYGRRAQAADRADRGLGTPTPLALRASPLALRGAGLAVPRFGPAGSLPIEVSPTDLLPVTNALDVVAADYIRADGRRVGAAFVTTTAPGEVYEHTKPVCDRLRGATLDGLETIRVAGQRFVLTRLTQADGSIDYAVSFVVYQADGKTMVDSRFLLQEYDTAAMVGEVLNLQVWAPSREYVAELVAGALAELSGGGDLTFRTEEVPPALPDVFVRSGRYEGGRLVLDVHNPTGATSLTLSGGSLTRAEGTRPETFSETVGLSTGTPGAPTVTVAVETGPLFDAAFFVGTDEGSSPDRLYLADGTWGVALDPASSAARLNQFSVAPEAGAPLAGARRIERAVTVQGQIDSWATVYRTLAPGGQTLDLSDFRYVEFDAAGSGDVHLLLQQAAITTSDHFGATVRLTPEGGRHRVWFTDLRLADGSGGFDGAGVVTLSLTARADGATPFEIVVSDVRFGGTAEDAAAAPDVLALLPPAPNPFAATTRLRFDLDTDGPVMLRVFDVLGREIARPIDQPLEAGRHEASFGAAGLAAGVYIVRLDTGGQTLTHRVTHIR